MRYVAPTRTMDESKARMQKHEDDRQQYGFGLLATELKDTGAFVGRCGLDPLVVGEEVHGELAWMFFPEYWRNGFATEFGTKMIEIGLSELGLRRIVAHAKHDNVGSIRVMEKIGMTFVKQDEEGVEYEVLGRQ